jgi:zinc transport system ATP-binding protein
MKELVVEHGTLGYGGNFLLSDFSLRLVSGAVYFLRGENGAGKTTLIRTLVGLHPLANGNRRSAFERHGLVPQSSSIDSQFPVTIRGFLELYGPLSRHTEELCAHFGLTRMNLPLRHCSGGELQKALLVRSLAGKSDFLGIDEPSALDSKARAALWAALKELTDRGGCAVVCTHETLGPKLPFRNSTISIRDGAVFESDGRQKK